jgi:hypothetical protein
MAHDLNSDDPNSYDPNRHDLNRDDPNRNSVSRRDFARRVAVAATALVLPEAVLAQSSPSPQAASTTPDVPKDVPKEVAAEVETKFNAILKLSAPGAAGSFTTEQKDEIRRQLVSQVQGLQKLRAYPLENGNAPALVLRVEPPVFVEVSSGPTFVAPEKK